MALNAREKRKIKTAAAIAILILFAIGAFSVFGIGKLAFWLAVPSPTATTKGRVIYYKKGASISRSSRETDRCWVSYEVEGKTYTNYGAGCGWTANVGEEVDVIYQTTEPKNSAVDSHLFVNSFGIAGLLMLAGAYLLIRKLRREADDHKKPTAPDTSLPISNQ